MIGKEKKYLNTKSETNCDKCKGMRLKDEALCVKINKLNISEITSFSIEDSQKWFSNLENILTLREKKNSPTHFKRDQRKIKFFTKCWFELFNPFERIRNIIRW